METINKSTMEKKKEKFKSYYVVWKPSSIRTVSTYVSV